MKITYKKILPALFLALSVWSCTEQSNLDPEGAWTLNAPVATTPTNNASLVLDETQPDIVTTFEWQAASSSANYGITYSVVIDTLGSTNFDTPILEVKSGSNGKDLSMGIKASVINEALSLAGYPANAVAQVSWAVKASCLSRNSYGSSSISVKRFANEILPSNLFITGDATEGGVDLTKALPLKRLNGADKTASNHFEIYTSLVAGKSYSFYGGKALPAHKWGGAEGNLKKAGPAIIAPESGVYRISLNLDLMTYTLLKIDKWSYSGTATIDLEYQGGGVWTKTAEIKNKGTFVFQANGLFALRMKRVKGTTSNVVMSTDAASQGVEAELIPSDKIGLKVITLDLSAGAYSYKIERDPSAPIVIDTPDALFLLQGTTKVGEFTKAGDVFTSNGYLPLQAGKDYSLNSLADGTGKKYSFDAKLGAGTLGGDKVNGALTLSEDVAATGAEYDQAFKLTIDFSTITVKWEYYNMKLFHWSSVGTGWDSRQEFVMTYVHPLTFTVTTNLVAGNSSKFNSPWEVQFGADVPGVLTGTMTNKGGADFNNITESGSYQATIVVTNDFKTGTYEMVKK